MVVNVLKRLESSVFSFRKTLVCILEKYESLLRVLNGGGRLDLGGHSEAEGMDDEDEINSLSVGKCSIAVDDLDVESYKRDLQSVPYLRGSTQ